MLRRYSPKLVFLSETKKSVAEMATIKNKLGDYDGISVDCRGRSGGLSMLWEKSAQVSLLSYSGHHIDVELNDVGTPGPWRFTGIYGWSETSLKAKTCDLLIDLSQHSNLPWLIGGDLNEILFPSEKKGGGLKSQGVLDFFCNTLDSCGLHDLGFTGYEFTWENRREGGDVVEERLDRFCASVEWSLLFPDSEVLHLDEHFSDHLPLLLKLRKTPAGPKHGRRRFMFENMWIQEEGCENVIREAWSINYCADPRQQLEYKIRACAAALSRWKQDTFGEIQHSIRKAAGQLRGEKNIMRRREILQEISRWRRKEEVFWAQRAKAAFMKHGDSNSKWFHARVKERRSNNNIVSLVKADGTRTVNDEELNQEVINYFSQLFTSAQPDRIEGILEAVPSRVTESMNDMLNRAYTEAEIREALSAMGPTKSPGPDGFNACFFQRFWHIVGKDVTSMVQSILAGDSLPPRLNHTHVVLIPKVNRPDRITEFRPISLCNVLYKIVTKVVSNRLKLVLPSIISETQSAFTPGRLITDNILIAYEVFHSMIGRKSRHGSMAIKVDMAKAYDRVEWLFLKKVMVRLGFRQSWVDMVMACVESATFSFIINGQPQGHIQPSRGLRQGDPISPYLFLLVTEGLIGLLKRAELHHLIQGHRVCRGAPPISHLLFADDSIFFCKASLEQAKEIRSVLKEYEEATGQQVNLSKSSITFCKGLSPQCKTQILQELNMREVENHDRYLGLPTHVGRSKKRAFIAIKERIGRRLAGWMNRLVSWAGREVLIKAVAQAIPTYAMSVFKFPKDLCSSIQAMLNRFWWSHDPNKRKIHWVGSEKLCDPKATGGLGFRDMVSFNDAMLAKQVWRLLQDGTSLVSRVLQARYYPSTDILSAQLGRNPSYTWRSLHGARELIVQGSRWIVGNGESINVWTTRWIPRPVSFRPLLCGPDAEPDMRVMDLIDKEGGCWKEDVVRQTFIPVDADIILRLPLCTSWPADRLIWHFTSNGVFSVKSAYHLAREKAKADLPSSSGGPIKSLWRSIWGLDVPPRIRLFGWRLGVGALPTKCNIARCVRDFDMKCEWCGHLEESDVHAVFVCPMAEDIWQASSFESPLWRAGPGTIEEYLVQAAETLDDLRFGEFVAVMWEIWNERNRILFGQRPRGMHRNLADRAVQFVKTYRDFKEQEAPPPVPNATWWKPPPQVCSN